MDFRQLEYVITVAREKTLLSAAKKLFLSPSALSQHISKLEDDLRTPLFKRTKQGWLPTPAGQVYIQMAESVLLQKENAYQQIGNIADNRAGYFTMGVTSGRGTHMFATIFPKFKEKYPQIKVGLVESTVLSLKEQIESGKVDLGFLTGGPDYRNLAVQKQVTDEILLVIPRTHPLAVLEATAPEGDFATVSLNQFKNDTFLLAGEGTTLRMLEEQMFANAGFLPSIEFESKSLVALNQLSRSGYGVSFVPRFYADDTTHAVYFHVDPPIFWDLVAVYRKEHPLTQAEEYMISLATEYYQSANTNV